MSPALLLVVLALSAYRLWRFVGKDQFPGEFIRDWLDDRVGRWWGYLYDGLTCPWCLGSWLAFAVTFVADLFGSVPMPGLFALAVAGLTGLLVYLDD